MVTFALCTAFGVFLCWQFSKAYFLGKKKHKELLADGYKFEVVDTSRLMMSVYLAAIVVAVCLFVYSILVRCYLHLCSISSIMMMMWFYISTKYIVGRVLKVLQLQNVVYSNLV